MPPDDQPGAVGHTHGHRPKPVCLILPSYHMYSHLYRPPSASDSTREPPIYLRLNLSTSESLFLTRRASEQSHRPGEAPLDPMQIVAADAQWESTIIDNIHDLKNLLATDNPHAVNTKIEVHFTEHTGVVGQPAVEVDPRFWEYNKGDTVAGYVLIENLSDEPVPFDMFYLLFEGLLVVNGAQHNFLQMFDFSASSNPANINRFATNWYYCAECGGDDAVDPVDGSHLSFPSLNLLKGVVYKRFFSFKIPEYLLESTCSHQLPGHTCVPPLMRGQARIVGGDLRDFSFPETSVTYGVMARFIGRKSHYNVDLGWLALCSRPTVVDSDGDEYIILQEQTLEIRVIQREPDFNPDQVRVGSLFNKSLYENLHARANEAIDQGKQLLSMETTAEPLETQKLRQLYVAPEGTNEKTPGPRVYSVTRTVVRKLLIHGTAKGKLTLLLPYHTQLLHYIHPLKFRALAEQDQPHLKGRRWQVQLPVTLTWDGPRPPLLYLFFIEFVVHTFQLDVRHRIPLEFHHDFIHNQARNHSHPRATALEGVDELKGMVDDTRDLLKEIDSLLKQAEPGTYRVEKRLVDDLKGISMLKVKANHLVIPKLRSTNGEKLNHRYINNQEWVRQPDGTYSKTFDVDVDLDSMQLKGYPLSDVRACDRFTLVPSFQSCHLGRMYHLRVTAGLLTGEYIHLKLPVNVAKLWAENIAQNEEME